MNLLDMLLWSKEKRARIIEFMDQRLRELAKAEHAEINRQIKYILGKRVDMNEDALAESRAFLD